MFLPRRGYRIQPRVSTLGNIQKKAVRPERARDHVGQMRPIATERKRVFVRQRYNLPLAKIMRTSTKWSDCGP